MLTTITIRGRQRQIGRAPKGGIKFGGKYYRGGQFVPVAALPVAGGAPVTKAPTTATIEVETIGQSKGWIARIAPNPEARQGFDRDFIGIRDYSRANRPRTRGVHTIATLTEGEVYEINSPQSWAKTDRYFATVRNGEIVEMSAQEFAGWLSTAGN